VLANHVVQNQADTHIFVPGLPVELTAVPDIGQTFLYWEISGTMTEKVPLIAAGDVWRYNDAVTNVIPGWSMPAFNDSAWPTGAAQLGYGDGDEVTSLSFGDNASNKRISYYFRKAITITNALSFDALELGLLRDDGAIVYLNGQEIMRSNMPTGTVDYLTRASSATAVPEANQFMVTDVALTNALQGTYVLAVEVHQFAGTSSDLSFDLNLSGTRSGVVASTNHSPQITMIPSAELEVRAVFAPSGHSVLPETVTSNLTLTAAQSPYLASGDIVVPPNVSLTVDAGSTLLMPDGASIYVEGELAMLGTTNAPVYVASNPDRGARLLLADSNLTNRAEFRWGCIAFDNATHTGRLINVVLRDASLAGRDPVNMIAAISARNTDLFMDGLDVDKVDLPIFVQDGSSAVLQRSHLRLLKTGDAINLKRTRYARVENCVITGGTAVDADAIDYDSINGGIIRGNRLTDFLGDNNDAIDIGEGAQSLVIESNYVARIADKAVSIGQASTALVRYNVMRDCTTGVAVKDAGSFGDLDHNTFHKTDVAIRVYEKNRGAGGGAAVVRNCILSETGSGPIIVDGLSTADVSYCLSDTEPVSGTGNRTGEPQFENAKRDNFRLQTGSAAIDRGAPTDTPDADGSRTDIGAVPFDWREGHAVISEIHYHPAHSNASEFVEIFNAGGAPLNLGGWHFAKGVGLVFPHDTIIAPGDFLVVAAHTNGLLTTGAVVTWSTGVLDNAGETLQLLDAVSNEMDDVTYSPGFPWPLSPDGLGPSLSLIHPKWDNQLHTSWYASALESGTPGTRFDNSLPGHMAVSIVSNGAVRITTDGLPGLLYGLEYTPSLMPADWTPLDAGFPAVGGQVDLHHSTNAAAGFYRVRIFPD